MRKDAVEYLIREVDEFMGAGSVGLYEFADILRDFEPPLTDVERSEAMCAALAELLRGGRSHLVWEVWARSDLTHPAQGIDANNANWSPPEGEREYLAIEPH